MIYYKQCAAQRNGITNFFWIPEKFAVKNNIFSIKENDNWQDNWKIKRVFTVRLSNESVLEKEYEYYVSPDNIKLKND